MTINKLTASFGKLNGESLEFTDGLNVICAPNESGKSTWCAFIRAMLYGIDSAERQRQDTCRTSCAMRRGRERQCRAKWSFQPVEKT